MRNMQLDKSTKKVEQIEKIAKSSEQMYPPQQPRLRSVDFCQ